MTNSPTADDEEVEQILESEFGDRVWVVEEDVVWVSGMNPHCPSVAEAMAKTLVQNDVPAGLVYDDGAMAHGGVQFNWGEAA